MSWKRWVHEVRYEITLKSPLHIGVGKNELLINENGQAVIPGSSLAGAWRAFIEQEQPAETVRLFGKRKKRKEEGMSVSDLYVHDLVSERVVSIEERPAVRIDGAFGSADDKGKFDRFYVAANERFSGKVVWTADEEEQNAHLNLMIRVFSAWHHGFIRLGKYKSTGAGRVEITAIRHRAYDCWNPKDYFAYLSDQRRSAWLESWGKDASDWLKESPVRKMCRFRLTAELDSPLLIRGNGVSKAGEPDSVSIRNLAGQYIIPGSSWKGVLRHHVEKIANYYGVSEVANRLFGYAAQKKSEGRAGVIIASDAIIQDARETDYTGIRIDRLTGGIMFQMLKKERTVRGMVELELYVRMDRLSDQTDVLHQAQGLLLLAFRDMAEQGLTLGSGYASGRGRLKGKCLTIQEGTDEVVVDFTKDEVRNPEKANIWISALARGRAG